MCFRGSSITKVRNVAGSCSCSLLCLPIGKFHFQWSFSNVASWPLSPTFGRSSIQSLEESMRRGSSILIQSVSPWVACQYWLSRKLKSVMPLGIGVHSDRGLFVKSLSEIASLSISCQYLKFWSGRSSACKSLASKQQKKIHNCKKYRWR